MGGLVAMILFFVCAFIYLVFELLAAVMFALAGSTVADCSHIVCTSFCAFVVVVVIIVCLLVWLFVCLFVCLLYRLFDCLFACCSCSSCSCSCFYQFLLVVADSNSSWGLVDLQSNLRSEKASDLHRIELGQKQFMQNVLKNDVQVATSCLHVYSLMSSKDYENWLSSSLWLRHSI